MNYASLALFLCFFLPSLAHGDVEISIYVQATTTAINAVEGTVLLDTAHTWEAVETGESIVLYWVTPPQIQGRSISFAGLIPGGFVGVATAAGLTGDGLLFRLKGVGENSSVTLTDTAVYLNDGEGSKIAPVAVEYSQREKILSYEEEEDRTPPEWVTGEVLENGDILLLVLAAEDKETGVAYFEVKEGGGQWVQTQNPYILTQESVQKPLYVRAYDQAGNFREIRISPPANYMMVISSVLLGLLILLLYFGIPRWKLKNRIS